MCRMEPDIVHQLLANSCMTWHDLIAAMTSALWLLVLHPVHSMRIGMSAVVSISGPPLDLQYSTAAIPGQLSEKEKKAVAKMDKKMGTDEPERAAEEKQLPEEEDERSDSQPGDDDADDDEPNAGSSKPAKSQAKSKAKAKAKAKAKPVAKAKKASTMKKPAKALQKKPSQK